MHFPKPKRTYAAVTLDFQKVDDGHWAASGSVTWSQLRGSTEGTVKSDAGNGAQADAGSTQDFDYLGLGDYGYGRLPNDHTWQFKLNGAYHFGKMFTLGANVFVQSPMPGSCLGIHPRYPAAGCVRSIDLRLWCGQPLLLDRPGQRGRLPDRRRAPAPRGTGWSRTG